MSLKPNDLGDWITLIVALVTIVGSLGTMYVTNEKSKTEMSARIYNIESRMESREGLSDRVSRLEEQRQSDREDREELKATLEKLSDSVSQLSVVLARMQGREEGAH